MIGDHRMHGFFSIVVFRILLFDFFLYNKKVDRRLISIYPCVDIRLCGKFKASNNERAIYNYNILSVICSLNFIYSSSVIIPFSLSAFILSIFP